jgi:hypothetical protein
MLPAAVWRELYAMGHLLGYDGGMSEREWLRVVQQTLILNAGKMLTDPSLSMLESVEEQTHMESIREHIRELYDLVSAKIQSQPPKSSSISPLGDLGS